MKNKGKIFIVHGGMTFENKKDYLHWLKTREISIEKRVDWKNVYLDDKLGDDFDIIRLRMPLRENAKFNEWKIHFERYMSHMRSDTILIGGSLGGIFLAKYLSENKLPHKVLSTYLVCPPFDNTLPEDYLVGGFELGADLSLLEKNSNNLYLMFSSDDDVVPIFHADKYRDKLPTAKIHIYDDKNGHFKVSEFPEIVKND